MALRLVPLDEGPEIILDRAMVVVGRHPLCDARLDSLRVSRHHCCMIQVNGDVFVRDLGSTNGIRINSQRVESGQLRPGDELSIAHVRFRLDDSLNHAQTLASLHQRYRSSSGAGAHVDEHDWMTPVADPSPPPGRSSSDEDVLAEAVRRLLPADIADKCRIQVIVEKTSGGDGAPEGPIRDGAAARVTEAVKADAGESADPALSREGDSECYSDSCL